ncbi:hypothetical protein LPB136_04510 [Tenacibaculum todarodis]|uniref:Uncharacterized protein n=1 Tax=Tenacibaculum todarodis TaxID=1850252 RepID=A0A1L3JHS0_9FLAO|nr:hypothetical protein LPB136_04510 [Tenacibaculum todarodis]
MKINNKSLCNSCIYAASCTLTSNKKFIWSCSEFEPRKTKNNSHNNNLLPNLKFTQSEKEIEII